MCLCVHTFLAPIKNDLDQLRSWIYGMKAKCIQSTLVCPRSFTTETQTPETLNYDCRANNAVRNEHSETGRRMANVL